MSQWIQAETHIIRVNALGEWLSDETPLHPRVAELFRKSVQPNPNGTYDIVLGKARQRIVVADTPFDARGLRLVQGGDPEQGLLAVTFVASDGREETLQPETLMQSEDHTLYCQIERAKMRVPCRFSPGQYHQLALFIREAAGSFELPVGEKAHRIGVFRPACKIS